MAERKTTRSPKRQSRMLRFPEVKGKTLESIEVDPDLTVITISFQDKTVLSFDLDPMLIVFPELGNMTTGNWRSIKKWPSIQSKPTMLRWP